MIEVTYEDDVAVPIQWEMQRVTKTKLCKPEECGLPQPPLIEGQKLMYIHPSQNSQIQVNKPIVTFFKNWAKSCHDKQTLDELLFNFSVRENKVSSYVGDISLLKEESYAPAWESLLNNRDPKVLIFFLKAQKKLFTEKQWAKILSKIPKYMSCLMLTPPTDRKDVLHARQIKNLKAMIEKTNSSCQIVSADEEILSQGFSEDQKVFKKDGTLTSHGLEQWWKTQKRHLCDVEPQLNVSEAKPKK